MKNILLQSIIIISISAFSQSAFAHSGKSDKNGGHTDKKTGIYHCHKENCHSKVMVSPAAASKHQPRAQAKNADYDRKLYPHWSDLDKDCQDSRSEALIAASSTQVKFKRNKGCNVSHGTFYDPYTDKTYTKASDLDADHVVPLKDAHETGGYAWTREKRRAFANDPFNIIPVYFSENRSKGARSPMEYMPPNKAYHCEYLTRWIQVKEKYELQIRSTVKHMYKKTCNIN